MAGEPDTSSTQPVELWSTELGLPADCVEFCPARPQLFVAGTYKLNEEGGERQGAVCAFRLLDGVKAEPLCPAGHQQPLAGVLDIKWTGSLLAAPSQTATCNCTAFHRRGTSWNWERLAKRLLLAP
ncbi:hypothetical protein HPB48_016603 [Haemaphysalis longicornis]|uniref:Uncharacterized protein n=1 Tax=Haemaphysalis longicornis TaxID=44386 RepID=A0A9J6FQ29_HAELO|nr:hypothetical protein HPB48_016603 [Haemaphysalis longicornis]